jgi:hypothetical protein
MDRKTYNFVFVLIASGVVVLVVCGFPIQSRGVGAACRSPRSLLICAAGIQDSDPKKKKYKFGDITRRLAKKATDKVNDLTGNEEYTFGDLSRWLDEKAKKRVQNLKGENGDYKYELGDIVRWADNLAKEKAAQYAGKEIANDYQVGDISRTVISKLLSGEYQIEDVYLALRVLVSAGFSISPITRILPVGGLISLINFGLAKDLGDRITWYAASALDARMKEVLTGDRNYQLGDVTKEKLRRALSSFTGKDTYEFGDIHRTIESRTRESSDPKNTAEFLLQMQVLDDLAKWDAKFQLEQDDSLAAKEETSHEEELAKWDKKYRDIDANK